MRFYGFIAIPGNDPEVYIDRFTIQNCELFMKYLKRL
jgi:hypothetical protein